MDGWTKAWTFPERKFRYHESPSGVLRCAARRLLFNGSFVTHVWWGAGAGGGVVKGTHFHAAIGGNKGRAIVLNY